MDRYVEFLEAEIQIAERQREASATPMMRMTYTGMLAAFKAALVCYEKLKASQDSSGRPSPPRTQE